MLIRCCAFPADRPAPSMEQSLDPEAIELWESDPTPSDLSDKEAIQVINVRAQLSLAHLAKENMHLMLCICDFALRLLHL